MNWRKPLPGRVDPQPQQPVQQAGFPLVGGNPIERAAVGGIERQKRVLVFRSGMTAYIPSQLSGLQSLIMESPRGNCKIANQAEVQQIHDWLVDFARQKRQWFRMTPQESRRWELYILQLRAIQTGQVTNPSELKELP